MCANSDWCVKTTSTGRVNNDFIQLVFTQIKCFMLSIKSYDGIRYIYFFS